MSDWFGFGFFEWWAGLERGPRLRIALLLLAVSGGTWFLTENPWIWCSGLATGCVLLLFALGSD